MRTLKLTLGSLLAIAALLLAGIQVLRIAHGMPPTEIVGAVACVGLVGLLSVLLFYSALVGSWELPDSRIGLPKSWLDGLRHPIDPQSRFARLLEGARAIDGRMPGDVGVVFHTYWGVLVFVVQTEWRFALPPDEARRILSQMHRSNLAWGNIALGAMFIPVLSQLEYWQQKRSIRRQVAGSTAPPGPETCRN